MRLSIVTPTRNAERWLPECLDSVRRQRSDARFVEHLVIEGESSDDSVRIARSFDARVIEVEHSPVFRKINLGFRSASGNVLGYLGGDDLLLPGAVKTVGEWFERGRAPFLIGGIRWIDGEGGAHGDLAAPPRWMTAAAFASLGWSCIQTPAVFLRREFFEELGGFDESYTHSGDYEFFARALARASFDRTNRVLAVWRIHGCNLSLSRDPIVAEERDRVRDAWGPRSELSRNAHRLVLKIWLNARSPGWFVHKILPDSPLRHRSLSDRDIGMPPRLDQACSGTNEARGDRTRRAK